MHITLKELGQLLKAQREERELTQEDVASRCATNRSAVAHLEQGLRIPKVAALEAICTFLHAPRKWWQPLAKADSATPANFSQLLEELVGRRLSLLSHDEPATEVAEAQVLELFRENVSVPQTFDRFNSVLVFYGVPPTSRAFFDHYLTASAFGSLTTFEQAVKDYQRDAIRLFSSMSAAFANLSLVSTQELKKLHAPLQPRDMSQYSDRTDWELRELIADERLPDLGYISAARVRKQATERRVLQQFLEKLAADIRAQGAAAISLVGEKTRRKMDSLLRKFDSSLQHGVVSPLFSPDADKLEREAAKLAPKTDDELRQMEETQRAASRNLAQCLAADHLDVYVATSMREYADYASVNNFVRELFGHEEIKPLKLRYFNPTQCWIEDRIAKGLVEALMLRRSKVTVYMAQKNDTFGKDCEASVALGQGKPVIVYVPKLVVPSLGVDSEKLFLSKRLELLKTLADLGVESEDVDDSVDEEGLVGRILFERIHLLSDAEICKIVESVWADFDLPGEAGRISEDDAVAKESESPLPARAMYRKWLDGVLREGRSEIPAEIRQRVVGILVATTINFEKRARLFRESHPLAVQLILSTGILNGILVVREAAQCGTVLRSVLSNELSLEFKKDERNYSLVERLTQSTIRVISRHELLQNAFESLESRQ